MSEGYDRHNECLHNCGQKQLSLDVHSVVGFRFGLVGGVIAGVVPQHSFFAGHFLNHEAFETFAVLGYENQFIFLGLVEPNTPQELILNVWRDVERPDADLMESLSDSDWFVSVGVSLMFSCAVFLLPV